MKNIDAIMVIDEEVIGIPRSNTFSSHSWMKALTLTHGKEQADATIQLVYWLDSQRKESLAKKELSHIINEYDDKGKYWNKWMTVPFPPKKLHTYQSLFKAVNHIRTRLCKILDIYNGDKTFDSVIEEVKRLKDNRCYTKRK